MSEAEARNQESMRLWRTSFLSLRDETLTSPPCSTLIQLVTQLIFSHSDALSAQSSLLPSHEATSDVVFLVELGRNAVLEPGGGDSVSVVSDFVIQLSKFIHDVSAQASLKLSSSSWTRICDSFGRIIEILLGKGEDVKSLHIVDSSRDRAIKQSLETIRYLFTACQRSNALAENKQLLGVLISVITCSQPQAAYPNYATSNLRNPGYNSTWDVQSYAFTMIGDIYSRVGSSVSVDIWQSSIQVVRKVMDALASKCLLVEDNVMARFYHSLLQTLHLILVDPKGSLSGHVAGLLAALKMFFNYGLINKSHLRFQIDGKNKMEFSKSGTEKVGVKKTQGGTYRPPHLRKKDLQPVNTDSLISSENESSATLYASSDSDFSDSDGSLGVAGTGIYAKTRLAAIVCVQDLCRADPKSFASYWTMLLPSSDVLQPRKYEANMISCLLFDPYLKARIASASTITTMLDGPASIFLQVAEFRESSKSASFTALSSSLGQILMQLHSGILYLIKHETNGGLLTSSFKVMILLISSTPYSRMPADLLPRVVSSIKARIVDGFPSRSDKTSLMVAAMNCLTVALSASPSSIQIKDMMLVEVSKGSFEGPSQSGILSTLIRFLEPSTNPSVSLEAFKALKAVAHNYPSSIAPCWQEVSAVIYAFMSSNTDSSALTRRVNVVSAEGATRERVITAAVKVLDECLRAISGFRGTEDISDEKLFDDPFVSDNAKTKTVSSAPYYVNENLQSQKELDSCPLGMEQWCEAISKHLPLGLQHPSGMVRASSVTCFAGMTSLIFFMLPKDKQDVILNSSIQAALKDEVTSVRSGACRAIGIIGCFPQLFQSKEILLQFIGAVERNSCDSQLSVRIAASWSLANICDSLRHCVTDETFKNDLKASSQLISSLIGISLRLAEDNDKVKANAVRALGNLSRFVLFTKESLPHSAERDSTGIPQSRNGAGGSNIPSLASMEDSNNLENMVQAFLSCVSTGNVKVQWNVCHAFSNLFCNETLELQNVNWASSVFSILLLLLRDSSNFKTRIQAAAALAVPATVNDYGRSFYDVLKGVEHIMENLTSDLISSPSNFKYKVALENQLTSTLLHLLSLASRTSTRATQDLIIKKASFLEEWFTGLGSTLKKRSMQQESEDDQLLKQKKDVILQAIEALIDVLEGSNQHAVAQKFKKLAESIL